MLDKVRSNLQFRIFLALRGEFHPHFSSSRNTLLINSIIVHIHYYLISNTSCKCDNCTLAHIVLVTWKQFFLLFSVPNRDFRNANVCLFVCLSVCHKRFLVWTWINWWIHGYYIQSFYFRIKQNMWNEWTCKMNSTVN